MKKIVYGIVGLLSFFVFVGIVKAEVNAVTPSTNDINRTNGWSHVDAAPKVGEVELTFIQPRYFVACFEYRTDGDTSQMTSPNNYNTGITDGLYPYFCLDNRGNTSTMTRVETIPANEYVEVRMVFGGERDERFDWTRFDVLPQPIHLTGKDVMKATGGIWMSGPNQQMQFSAFDQGDTVWDKGTVEYWNYDYPGVLNYTANVMCASVDKETHNARFMFQIPEGWPGLSGLYVVVGVHDGGTPGTKGDTYGHAATANLATATQWCETGDGFSPSGYSITAGNLVVHK